MTSAPIPVLINRSGGTAASMGMRLGPAIEAAFAAAGVQIDLHLIDGRAVRDAVSRVLGAPVIVIGGGDGTLGSAADIVAGSGSALGIVPLGTRNHLARELGIPPDLPGAAAVIAAGATRRIDVARANGRGFINNASIGFYPSLVRFRDAQTHRHGLPKWLAAIPASYAAIRRLRHHRLRISGPGMSGDIVTPMLFVGNNRYSLAAGRLGRRDALDDGTLSVFAVGWHRRRALIGFALRTLIGRGDRADDFAAIGDCRSLRVDGRSHGVSIALDGEVMTMALPIVFAIDPCALAVVVPFAEHA